MKTYETLSQAINGLKAEGYTTDFNLSENCLVCNEGKFDINDFEIVNVFRFEGETNPDDSSILYVIESNKGHKGLLVSAYGVYAEGMSAEMALKLRMHTTQ
ncbi:MAG: phosphoribosylpyrophosphate synthetase [Terrimonas sp.]|nr:phosphoribosylpyrophosphate synthetase [Terrimonas sp.]